EHDALLVPAGEAADRRLGRGHDDAQLLRRARDDRARRTAPQQVELADEPVDAAGDDVPGDRLVEEDALREPVGRDVADPGADGGVSVSGLPVIARTSAVRSNSLTSPFATTTPLRRTVMRSEICMTSSSLWLTKTNATPRSFSDATTRNSACTSRRVKAVVGSSMKMIRASCASARQIAVSCRSATESSSTAASRSSLI